MSKPHLQVLGVPLSTEGWGLLAAFAATAAMRPPALALRQPATAARQPVMAVWQWTPDLRQPAMVLWPPATAASETATHSCQDSEWQKALHQGLSCCCHHLPSRVH